MRYIALVLLLILFFPFCTLAQSQKQTDSLRSFIMKQEIGVGLRFSSLNENSQYGRLINKQSDTFEILTYDGRKTYKYSDIKSIKNTGRTNTDNYEKATEFVFHDVFTLPFLTVPWLIKAIKSPFKHTSSENKKVQISETSDLIKNVSGYVVIGDPAQIDSSENSTTAEVNIFELPSLKKTWLPGEKLSYDNYLVSGPDLQGSVVFVENYRRRSGIVKSSTDGKHLEIIKSSKDLPDNIYITNIVLSKNSMLASLCIKNQLFSFYAGEPVTKNGYIEVLDINKKSNQVFDLANTLISINYINWFADGKHLAYVDFVPKSSLSDKLQKELKENKNFSVLPENHNDGYIPVVYSLDIETGNKEALTLGRNPVISLDNNSILVMDYKNQCWLTNLSANTSKEVTLPGLIRPIGFIRKNLILYLCSSTQINQGAKIDERAPVILKIADIETGKIQTLLSGIPPRANISLSTNNKD